MNELYFNVSQINEFLEEIIDKINTDTKIILKLSTYDLLKVIIKLLETEKGRSTIINKSDTIIKRCITNFGIYDYMILRKLKNSKIKEQEIENIFNETCNKIFTKKTLIFLNKIRMFLEKEIEKMTLSEVNELIFHELEKMDTSSSSMILFDLYLMPDFKQELKNRYPVVKTLIDSYEKYFPDVATDNKFKGSSIIGKLIEGNNQYLVKDYLDLLLNGKKLNDKNIKMIGGGGSCLVYKIGNDVIKLGETRHNRKIFINHRILSSKVRKLLKDPTGKDLFYVEVMKYIETKGITKEDLLELKKDLYEMGLVWEDAKIENCGILPKNYDNEPVMKVDFIDVLANIENEDRKREFLKREKRVVVLDNDCINYNPLRSSN